MNNKGVKDFSFEEICPFPFEKSINMIPFPPNFEILNSTNTWEEHVSSHISTNFSSYVKKWPIVKTILRESSHEVLEAPH